MQSSQGSGSGGWAEHMVRYLAREVLGHKLDTLEFKALKNPDFREVILEDGQGGAGLKVGIANGFRNIQNLVQKMKRKRCDYDYVEVAGGLVSLTPLFQVLACPGGCLNGGAQVGSDTNLCYSFRDSTWQ